MSTSSVLIVGATGMIGSTLLPLIQETFPSWTVTAVIRPQSSKRSELERLHVKVIENNYDESLVDVVSNGQYDIVIDMADSSNVAITNYIIQGLEKAASKGKLLHLSGTGNFVSPGDGTYEVKRIWDDGNESDILDINDQMGNGPADNIVLQAGHRGLATWILCPGGIYTDTPPSASGSQGVFVKNYLNNAHSLGYIPYIKDGSAVFLLIHVADVASAIILLLKEMSKPVTGNPESRYYVAGGEEYSWKSIAEAFGSAVGLPAKSVDAGEAGYMAGLITTNMLVKETRLAQLGWKAKNTDMRSGIDRLLKNVRLPIQ